MSDNCEVVYNNHDSTDEKQGRRLTRVVAALKKQTKVEKVGLGIRRRINILAISERVHWKNGCPNQKEKKKIPSVLQLRETRQGQVSTAFCLQEIRVTTKVGYKSIKFLADTRRAHSILM